MLKLAYFLAKYRSLISVILFAPLLSLAFGSQFRVGMVPENPFQQFDVYFKVPSRTTSEIEKKVTAPAEKVFNGLPDLIGVQSKTEMEMAKISLRFHEKAQPSTIYLNIQEKMDRIKLLIPGDVESYEVVKFESHRPADLKFEFSEAISIGRLQKVLSSFYPVISQSEPSLQQGATIVVSPLPEKLAENHLSVSEVVQAMRSLGMTTSLGRSQGVMFETGRSFQTLDDVKSALVGSRGHRPVLLRDVTKIDVTHRKPVRSLQIWLDQERADSDAVQDVISQLDSKVKVTHPLWEAILSQTVQPILLILLCFLLNFYVIKVLKLPATSLVFLALMGGLVCVHFLFWKGLFSSITVLDLHALAFTLIVGSMFLSVLYLRIRSFFRKENRLHPHGKTLEQAKLFALAELAPTFLVLVLALWIMALPTLTSAVNLPSREIFASMFYFGFPVMSFIITYMLLSSPGYFLREGADKSPTPFQWSLSAKWEKYGVVAVFAFTILAFFAFVRFDVGVQKDLNADFSDHMVSNFRGYESRLVFRATSEEIGRRKGVSVVEENKRDASEVYQFSVNGLQFLADLDLLGFQDALKSLQKELVFADVHAENEASQVAFSLEQIGVSDLPSLLVANSSNKNRPHKVRTLMDKSVMDLDTVIVRDNMTRGDRVVLGSEFGGSTFLQNRPEGVEPTPWTGFLIGQFQRYKSYHIVSLIFLFLAFAMYLNSFVRGGLILIFALATAGFELIVHLLLPVAYHADSLWLGNMGSFMGLFQILVLARLIDIERSRGHDRDKCIDEIQASLAQGVYFCSWSFVLALFVAGLTEFIPGLPTLGFWREALVMSITSGLILIFSSKILFPLYYMRSETVFNNWAFSLYKVASKIFIRN
ncbi:MAG: efflux RND transporter permease subunit [Bdellovibrionales bacterium]|nr:efflux RND transporter permease subunit [Bdellovibrionales bacterium]